MPIVRPCETCGKMIIFRRNSRGKVVPFDFDPKQENKCGYVHFESCTQPPGSCLFGDEPKAPVVIKPVDKLARAYLLSGSIGKLQIREQQFNRKLDRWVRCR
jgi:hypothetical protein